VQLPVRAVHWGPAVSVGGAAIFEGALE
jgi:hypothetical protein